MIKEDESMILKEDTTIYGKSGRQNSQGKFGSVNNSELINGKKETGICYNCSIQISSDSLA